MSPQYDLHIHHRQLWNWFRALRFSAHTLAVVKARGLP
jgi:hypothetical protein